MNNTKWALVTGSSSGIGKAIAIELDNRGYNVILHGRNQDSLLEVSNQLKNHHKILNLDLIDKNASENMYQFLDDQSIELEILVNNAGFGVPGDFKSSSLNDEIDLIELQCSHSVKVIKEFIKRKSEKRRYILNVSSLYSLFPVPKQSVYGAVKAFMHSFSLAISYELKSENIFVSSTCPGLTESNFRIRQGKKDKKSKMAMSGEYVARVSLDEMFKGTPEIIPGFKYKFIGFLLGKLPKRISLSIIYKMNIKRGF